MDKPKVYEGHEPYVFISYAHANAPAVMQVAEELSAQGFRIWYDEGIEVGSEWPEYIASHLAGSGLMLAFMSNAYMRSDNCRKEMHFALTKKIPVVTVFLEDTVMTPGMEMQIGSLFALMKYTMRDEVFYEKLFSAPQLSDELRSTAPPRKPRPRRHAKVPVDLNVESRRRRKRKVRRTVTALLLLAILIAAGVLGLIGWKTGFLQQFALLREQAEITPLAPDTEAAFSSPVLEKIARDYCGKSDGTLRVGDLAALRELHLSGEEIGGETLRELRFFPDLQALTLEDAPLHSLEALSPCGIETLTIRGGTLSSLEGIGNLPHLQELRVEGCPLRELGDLGRCLELRTLSLLGGNLHDISALRPLRRLAQVELSGCTLSELRPVLRNSALSELSLTDCDLRGRFFRAFDREGSLVRLSLVDCALDSTDNLEDFDGLTTLRLIRSGESLDFSALASLAALRSVQADETMIDSLRDALRGSGLEPELVEG